MKEKGIIKRRRERNVLEKGKEKRMMKRSMTRKEGERYNE
jgi:hypothetical protein